MSKRYFLFISLALFASTLLAPATQACARYQTNTDTKTIIKKTAYNGKVKLALAGSSASNQSSNLWFRKLWYFQRPNVEKPKTTSPVPNPNPPVSDPQPAATNNVQEETEKLASRVLSLINQYRNSIGLDSLRQNAVIDSQASGHSEKMASGKTAFGHDGFSSRVSAIKNSIGGSAFAENVAYNKGYSDPAKTAVDGWLKSPGHKANIEGNYALTGIGVSKSKDNSYYFTQIFMR